MINRPNSLKPLICCPFVLLVTFAAGIWSGGHLQAADQPLLTFVLAGQSNMVGKRCKKETLPDEYKKPQADALFYQSASKKWIPLEPGKTQRQGFGPEITFGFHLAKRLKQPIGIIKLSKGGTNLDKQWSPKGPKSLYHSLLQQVKEAQATRPLTMAGMLWIQGGADAKSEAMANRYSANLTALINAARKDFGNPEMAFLSGRIPPKSDKKKPHWKVVRTAQQDLKASRYAWIDCDALSKGSDHIHYDTKGMVDLGIQSSVKMASFLKK